MNKEPKNKPARLVLRADSGGGGGDSSQCPAKCAEVRTSPLADYARHVTEYIWFPFSTCCPPADAPTRQTRPFLALFVSCNRAALFFSPCKLLGSKNGALEDTAPSGLACVDHACSRPHLKPLGTAGGYLSPILFLYFLFSFRVYSCW